MFTQHFPLLVALLLSLPFVLAKQKVLLYTRTAGFRHDSIPDAVDALKDLGDKYGFDTVESDDQDKFLDKDWIFQFDALVFVSVSGKALSNRGAANMRDYIEEGGGYFGIHEACDALYKEPWYGRLVGAYFNYHPYIQHFTLDVHSHDHPSTSFLNDTWKVYDEVYTFNSNPRDVGKTVLLTADTSTYKDPTGDSTKQLQRIEGTHPIAWYKEGDQLTAPSKKVGGGLDDKKSTPRKQRGSGGAGRSYYTALGHTKHCWKDDDMQRHVFGALRWVLDSPSIRSNNATLSSSAPGSKYEDPSTRSKGPPPKSSSTSSPVPSSTGGATLFGSNASKTTPVLQLSSIFALTLAAISLLYLA